MQLPLREVPRHAAAMMHWTINYLRHVLTEKAWTPAELARRAKVAHSTINRPATDPEWPHAISLRTINKVRSASGIDPGPFAAEQGEVAPVTLEGDVADPGDRVAIFNVQASAGHGVVVPDDEEVVDSLAFPPGYLRSITSAPVQNLAIVTVKGDSMSPTLREGDVVMIDTTKTSLGYDGLFVLRMDGALHVKRVTRGGREGLVKILSDNRDDYPSAERPMDEVSAVGKVLWYGRKE